MEHDLYSKPFFKTLLASITLLTAAMGPAAADSLSWSGAVDTDWTKDGNWLNGGAAGHAPQAGDSVDIDTPASAIIYNNLGAPIPNIAGLTVGNGASGNLTINNALTSTTANLGAGATANGSVTVSGSLGRWSNGDLTVGNAGLGIVTITAAGGYSGSGAATIAADSGSSGTIGVSGGSSYFQTSGPFVIGKAGAGRFEVVTGAAASTAETTIAKVAGATGTVNIAGGGTTWTAGDLTVGDGGLGTVSISTGATVSVDSTVIGSLAGSDGSTVGLSGSGSAFDTHGSLIVGQAGDASLTIFSGATVSSGSAVIGAHANGSVRVGGLGSVWTSGALLIGGDGGGVTGPGNGTLDISGAGQVESSSATLGYADGDSGIVTVDGGGTQWDVTNSVIVGRSGSGLTKITNAGTVQSNGLVLGDNFNGSGTVLVTGGGSTWRDDGDLIVGGAGTGALQVTLGGTLSASSTTIGRDAGSTGKVTVTGDGSTFSTAGSLTIGDASTGTVTVADGGTISAGSITIAAQAGSTGTLNVGSTLGQTAAGAATLDTSAIHFGAGSGTLVFNFGGPAYTLSASVDGNGAIDVADGSVSLSSDSSSFSGITTVSGGRLTVNGLLGGTMLVNSGVLSGTGTVGTTSVASGATIAPGSGVGILTVAGDLTFASGALYTVDVDGTGSDLIKVSGTARLVSGAAVSLGDTSGLRAGKTYTVLSASRGVIGTFGAVASSAAFVDTTLGYDTDDVTLTLTRNTVAFASTARTVNQRSAAEGVESLGGDNSLYQSVETLSAEQARNAFGQLAGALHGALTTATFDNSRFVRTIGIDRLRSAFDGVGAASGSVFVLGGPPGGASSALGYGETQSTTPAAQAAAAILADPYSARAVGWGQAYGGWGRTDGDANAAGIKDSVGGVAIGADAPFRETTWRIGVMGGYSKGNFDQANGSASGSSDNYDVGVYGGNQWGPLALRVGALYERQSIATQRNVEFSGFSQSLAADYDAATAQIYGELGYRIDAGRLAFEPFANAAYVHQHSDAFNETGGSAALSSAAENAGVTFTTLGLRTSTGFALAGLDATARSSVGWRHAYGDTTTQSSFHFAGGDDFTTVGTALDKDSLVLDAGLDFAAAQASTIGINYSGQYGSGSLSQTVKANLAVRF
ncbi:autotransporter domain-containing protein [Rhizobium sp. rho-13.1]|nr:autotransporter domain-containing protein [Rhizobium sp. rho-13.1]TQY07011.1 autotransporter domain-containing protein [Rhizobium sp. rho-1.1]